MDARTKALTPGPPPWRVRSRPPPRAATGASFRRRPSWIAGRRFAHSESSSARTAARVRWDPVEVARGVFGCVADNAPAALLDPPIATGGSRVAPSCGL